MNFLVDCNDGEIYMVAFGSDGGVFGTRNNFAYLYRLSNDLRGNLDFVIVDRVSWGSPRSCAGVDTFVGMSFRFGSGLYLDSSGNLVVYESSRNIEPFVFSSDDTVCFSQWTTP